MRIGKITVGALDEWTLRPGSVTSWQPTAAAADGFSNLQCYQLGLDPIDPHSTFRAQILEQPGTRYPQITWNSVGGKTYSVEFADPLGSVPHIFTQALTLTATNVPDGVETLQTFIDTFTLTGKPPGPSGRYYRINCLTP